MKVISLAGIIGTCAAAPTAWPSAAPTTAKPSTAPTAVTTVPTAAPTAAGFTYGPTAAPTFAPTPNFIAPTVPSKATAMITRKFSDASCTTMTRAEVSDGVGPEAGNGATLTYKTNICIASSTTSSYFIDTQCNIPTSKCVYMTSYDKLFYATPDCSGTAAVGPITVNLDCHPAHSLSGGYMTHESSTMWENSTLFVATEKTLMGSVYDDINCLTSTAPIYIHSEAGSGVCSDKYTQGLTHASGRISLVHKSTFLTSVQLYKSDVGPGHVDSYACESLKNILEFTIKQGQCSVLDATTTVVVKSMGLCSATATHCYGYFFKQAHYFPVSAASTSAVATAAVVGALGVAALLA